MNWTDLQRAEVAPEALLAMICLGLAVLDGLLRPRRASRAGVWAVLFALLTALAMALQAWDRPWRTDTIWLGGDPASAFADVLILTGVVLAALLGLGGPASLQRGSVPLLMLLGTLGALIGAGARDLLTLFVGLELGSLSVLAYGAIGAGSGRRPGLRASLRSAGPAGAASGLTVLGIACLWSAAGSPAFDALNTAPASTQAAIGGGLLLIGLVMRAGAVPFHLWLADVAVGSAPAAVLLSLAAGILPALIVLGRLASGPLAQLVPAAADLLLMLALATSTVGAVLVLPQRRLRRLLGYATLSHIGFVLAGIATHSGEDPFSGTMWMQLAALVPAVAGCLAVSSLAGQDFADSAAGLARRLPVHGALLALFLIALAGLPPTMAFAGRSLLWSALSSSGPAAMLIMINGFVLAFGLVRFVSRVLFDAPPPGHHPQATSAVVAAAVLAAAVVLVFGLWPAPIARAAELAAGAG